MAIQWLPVAAIRTDAGTQIRVRLNRNTVEEYRDLIIEAIAAASEKAGKNGDFMDHFEPPLPPVDSYNVNGDQILSDGFHRLEGYKLANMPVIPSEVRDGTFRDALLHAIGANSTHGLPRSNADKRKAVETLLQDEEWRKWSNAEIARAARVSKDFVRTIRAMVAPLEENAQRVVRRGEQEYVQNTENIAQSNEERALQRLEAESPALARRVRAGEITLAQAKVIQARDDARSKAQSNDSRGHIAEDDYDDDEWLGSLPTFRELLAIGQADVFRAEALSWRTLDQREAFDQWKAHLKASFRGAGADGPLSNRILPSFTIPHPINWLLCDKCKGHKCEACRDSGYFIPLEVK